MVIANKKRVLFTILMLLLFAGIVVARFVYLAFTGSSTRVAQTSTPLMLRGNIYDRNGRILAINKPNYSVFANPVDFDEEEIKSKLASLARLLKVSERNLIAKFNLAKRFNWLKRKVSKQVANDIKKLNMRGIFLREEYKRIYPYNNFLSHILGFANIDNKGIEGVEYSFNKYLGVPSPKADRNILSSPILKGSDIHLTIDYDFQKISEKIISQSVHEYDAISGTVIIMNASNGEILSFANYPNYNNNNFSKYPKKLFLNKGIANYYAPGSILKVFTAAMLFEENLVSEDDYFFCPGSITISRRVIKCSKKHGKIQFKDVIKKSCNVGIIKASFRISNAKFYRYLKKFGFGSKTNIQVSGEGKGILPNIRNVNRLSKSMLSFGYELGLTLIQLTRSSSAFANGGILYKPLIVNKIVSQDGETKLFEKEPVRQIMSKSTANRVYKTLVRVLEDGGTGYKAYIAGLNLAGKTSTTNIYDKVKGSFDKDRVNMSFIGFIPYNDVKLTALVFVQEPKKGIKSASHIAAPIFKRIVSELQNTGLIVH